MKKIIYWLVACLLLLMPGCQRASQPQEGKLQVVVTIFPEYDWVREITSGDDDVELTLLLDNGVDLHSFQPTAQDIAAIASCDLFIYVGGESDGWVEDALKESKNPNRIVLNLLEILGDKAHEEEMVEGMEPEEEEDDEEEGPELDEHVWLSLRNAEIFCNAIQEALSQLDPEKASLYKDNADRYIEQLSAMDAQYEEAVNAASVHTLLFGDRFPFRYLTEDYGLTYYAAFVGCSAETEASFQTISFLAGKVDELGLHEVMTIEGTDHSIAETIVRSTAAQDVRILTMDSMQATGSAEIADGATYLGIMQKNLEVLSEGLGG